MGEAYHTRAARRAASIAEVFANEQASTSALAPSQRMRVAYLLAMVGGFLDAYTYFERGGVFANAQTGNIVKLGIALANRAGGYHFFLFPIASFALGVLAALCIEDVLRRRGMRLVRRVVLGIEIAALVLAGLVPLGEQWDIVANCLVSFVSALQFETFKTFHGEAINTMMSTGNLKKCMDNLYAGIVEHDAAKLYTSGVFATVLSIFTLGAFLGTRACDMWGRAAVIPPILLLACVIAIITVLRREQLRERE